MVHPGNKEYVRGDKIKRPEGGGGNGSGSGKASDTGEGEDDFEFNLTKEEFMEIFFGDLALPRMVQKSLSDSRKTKVKTAGIVSSGSADRLHMVRSFRGALGRKIGTGIGPSPANVAEIQQQIEAILVKLKDLNPGLPEQDIGLFTHKYNELVKDQALNKCSYSDVNQAVESFSQIFNKTALRSNSWGQGFEYLKEIALRERTLARKGTGPYFDPIDLKYRGRVQVPVPESKAVMFCMMDVSGSMDEARKDLAKRFFILLYLFLEQKYDKIDIVFIRQHTTAKEVNEEEFRTGKDTGGTNVSTAFALMDDIVKKRYNPAEWNIFGAYSSDGDNSLSDNDRLNGILKNDIIPISQFIAYLQVVDNEQELWDTMAALEKESGGKVSAKKATSPQEIYPVFRKFFQAQGMDTSPSRMAAPSP